MPDGALSLDQMQAMLDAKKPPAAPAPAGGISLDAMQAKLDAHKPPAAPAGLADRTAFPFDRPGVEYGMILPLARDTKTGHLSLAVPEAIRAPLRGMVTDGERLVGMHPEEIGKAATPDETSAVGLFATPLGQGIEAAGTAAGRLVEKPGPVGGVTREEATATAKALPKALKAKAAVERRLAQDVEGTGTTAQEVIDKLTRERALGKPAMLVDVGPNVRGLAGAGFWALGYERGLPEYTELIATFRAGRAMAGLP